MMKLNETWFIVMATAMLCIFAQPILAASAMGVDPAYIVWQGDEFTVNMTVDPAENEVYGASYTLHFDNTILDATSQTQGPFLTQDSQSSTILQNMIDNPNGTIEYSESRMGIDFGVTDPGVLTTITFQVIGVEGTSPLGISEYNGELLYSTSGSITTDINNGTCKIEDTTTPTTSPTTTVTSTPVQTPTTISITPTPTAIVTQTPTTLSTPLSPPTTIASPISPTVPTSPPEEKSEENNGLSGFRSVFVIIGLLAVFILKRKNVGK